MRSSRGETSIRWSFREYIKLLLLARSSKNGERACLSRNLISRRAAGDFIRRCQTLCSGRSMGNSASLPIGITSRKMDKIVGEARTEARLTVAALEKTEAPRNNEIESATRVCLVRTPMEERQVSFDTYLSDDCLVFFATLSTAVGNFENQDRFSSIRSFPSVASIGNVITT